MSKGRRLKALLVIEGRTIPFTGATCSFRVGQPATAAIDMVPLREINDILPRTMVHLFVKDFTHADRDKPWILAFEGEVYGFSLGKNPDSRNFNLHCIGVSNYWDNAKQYYMNTKTDGSSINNQLVSTKLQDDAGKENTQVVATPAGLKSYLVNKISTKLKKDGNNAFLEAILEAVKGVEDVNPFFRYANQRYRLNDRLGFKPSGNLDEIFDFVNREQYFESLIGKGNGGLVTIRQIINMLMGLIFHDFTTAPFPSKIRNGVKKGIGDKKDLSIGSFLFKPESYMLPPPKCNVLYPDQYSSFGFTRNFFHEVSRLKVQPNALAGDILSGAAVPRVFVETQYAPSGFSDFKKSETSEVKGTQHKNAGASGKQGDDLSDNPTSSKLRDYHFLSYEEVLKGIFSEQGNMMPSAQLLVKDSDSGTRSKFYQRSADFLFNKKRLASRNTTTSGPLNFSPIPGFPILLIDDSVAEQHVIGKLEGITHSFTCNGGGITNYEISYGRPVEEKDLWDGTTAEPTIPPWYDEESFGSRREVQSQDYENLPKPYQDRIKDLGEVNDFGNSNIKEFYAALLGDSKLGGKSYLGASPITTKKFPNLTAATFALVEQYRAAKKKGNTFDFINQHTRRNYVYLTEVFEFLGAELTESQKWATYTNAANIVFKGGTFDGNFVDNATTETDRDLELKELFRKDATEKRRAPIKKYRARLFRERGFRG